MQGGYSANVGTRHRRTVPSLLPETSSLPSALKARDVT
jgi:hypothetical protein